MKKTLSYFLLIFIVFFSNTAFAKESIYHIDIQFILKNSLAGKSIKKQLDNKGKSYSTSFKKTESKLKEEETKIVAQKNILEKSDFDKKVKLFNQKVSEYQKQRNSTLKDFSKYKAEAQSTLLNKLIPILANYSEENSISYIIPKQSIIIGKSELDLTKKIIDIFNTKVKSINLK